MYRNVYTSGFFSRCSIHTEVYKTLYLSTRKTCIHRVIVLSSVQGFDCNPNDCIRRKVINYALCIDSIQPKRFLYNIFNGTLKL